MPRPLFLALTGVIAVAAVLDAAQFGFLRRSGNPEYVPFSDPRGFFAVEYPKDWQIIAGAGDVLITFSQNRNEAAVIVERFKMNTVLAPDEITELFAEIEIEVLKERQPNVTNVASAVIDNAGAKLIVIDYERKGLRGPERVRQYSMPSGQSLFRLTCSTTAANFARYDPMFTHMSKTFTAGAPPAAAAAP
jgi:hypothetical protein